MNKYYISSNCYLLNKKLYYNDIDNIIKINKKNWRKYLKEYGWSPLSLHWRKLLNNKNFGVLDCGSNGDCLFHVFAEGLNLNKIYKGNIDNLYDISDIRKLAADGINKDNFDIIIENYKCETDYGLWDINSINCIDDLKSEIIKEGDNFWGDHIILQLIQEKLNINVILLDENNIHYMVNDIYKYDNTIIIYYLDQVHFQLIGYFNGNYMQTIFNKNEIPKPIKDLYDR